MIYTKLPVTYTQLETQEFYFQTPDPEFMTSGKGTHKSRYYYRKSDYPLGVTPIAVTAQVNLPDSGKPIMVAATGLTYQEAKRKAKFRLREKLLALAKKEKPVIRVGKGQVYLRGASGVNGYGTTYYEAVVDWNRNLEKVNSLVDQVIDLVPKPEPKATEEPKITVWQKLTKFWRK